MTSRDFCYWLQGYFEVRAESKPGPEALLPEQVDLIKRHLALVFVHEIDPSQGGPAHQEELQKVHDGGKKIGGTGPGGIVYRC